MEKYTISEVSKICDIPSSTLRYYEELGIISDVERDSGGQRLYSRSNIDRIEAIGCFKGAGMTMAEIKAFFKYEQNEYESIDDMMELLRGKQVEVKAQFAQLFKAYKHLLRKLDYYGAIDNYIKGEEEQSERPRWGDYGSRDYSQEAFNDVENICQNLFEK
ncbi:MAG: MerR family transcriptional regulator [Eubacterium sp.]|nr:MerR family transcriptional regulator [Eubacterium sp.]